MTETIYTVETGEYSDHKIHAFCTTLKDGKRCAAEVWEMYCKELCIDDEDRAERIGGYSWPRLNANPVNTCCSYMFVAGNELPVRVKWCDADPVKP